MKDHRSFTAQPPPSHSRGNSDQSSRKVSTGSQPISPKGDTSRSPPATPVAATPSSALASKPPAVDGIEEKSAPSSKFDLSGHGAIKDPRLRRMNSKAKPSSESTLAHPPFTSPQPLVSAVNKPASTGDHPQVTTAGLVESTNNLSEAQNFSTSTPVTPVTDIGNHMNKSSTLSGPTIQKSSVDDTDVAMTDINQASATITSVPQDPIPAVQSPQGAAKSPNLMESFVKLMTNFADQVSSTSILKYKREIAKQKSSRCAYNDQRNRKYFKDYPVTIEQGTQARQLAEQELASVTQKLREHSRAQNELARTMAMAFVSEIERQKSSQDSHSDKASTLQKTLSKVEELSANVADTLTEIKQIKLNTDKSVKEAWELVDRATSTCKEAQQAAQKTFTQVNEVTTIVNNLFGKVSDTQTGAQQAIRNAAALNKDVSEDHAQIVKVMSLVEHLEDDMKSLRKRTANAEDDVKNLWDSKAQSAVLEGMRKDINGDVAHFKRTQRDLASQLKSLEVNLKKCLEAYEMLAPEVETHRSKIEELNVPPKSSSANDLMLTDGIEVLKSNAPPDERYESLTQKLQSDIKALEESFQDLSQKLGSSASQSEVATLRESVSSLQTEIEKFNVADISQKLEAYRKDFEADNEDLRELTKEVDELHAGQDQIRDTFTAHNESIATRVEKAEKDINGMSLELKEALGKTKDEAQTMAKQLNDVSKRVEATMTAATARPTPPSAPPTPQMHQSAHPPGRGSSPPAVDNGVLATRLDSLARDFLNLSGYINGQLSTSPNLPATLNSLNQAIMNLQSRYNNLTTEPVVRAMVQQMQVMYPYASTVQSDIRVVRAAISELEKLPPKLGLLTTQVDLHTKSMARLEQKFSDQEKERASNDNKQDRLVAHVKEERDNLKKHVQEQHEELKQHLEEQYNQLGKTIAALKEESISSVAQVAAKVIELEQAADFSAVPKRIESLSQPSEEEILSRAAPQLSLNGPTSSHVSSKNDRVLSQTTTSTADESDRETLLKQFDASPSSSRRVAPKLIVSDSDDSDAPLASSRTYSSKSITAASSNGDAAGTSAKRKRPHNTPGDGEERRPLAEIPPSPPKRKVPRRA